MKLSYLILAHEHPQQLARLIEVLRTDGVQFFVHIDAKAAIEPFLAAVSKDVHFCQERVDCTWGNISLVDATLSLIRDALAAPRVSDRYVLLSGVCYPLQTVAYIDSFFANHRSTEFIECFSFPNVAYGKPISRLDRYWIKRARPFSGLKWRLQQLLLRYGPRRKFAKVFGGMTLVVGSQWWALTREALEYTIAFIEKNVEFYRFCRNVDCPDEFVIQTILFNSPMRDHISHTLTHTRWTPGHTGPDFVDVGMLERFHKTPVLSDENDNCPNEKKETIFVRKVSPGTDVLDELDRLLATRIDEKN